MLKAEINIYISLIYFSPLKFDKGNLDLMGDICHFFFFFPRLQICLEGTHIHWFGFLQEKLAAYKYKRGTIKCGCDIAIIMLSRLSGATFLKHLVCFCSFHILQMLLNP